MFHSITSSNSNVKSNRKTMYSSFLLISLINRRLLLTQCLMLNLILLLQECWQILLASTATCSSSAVCLFPPLPSLLWCLSTGWTDKVTRRRRGLSLKTETIWNLVSVWLLMLETTKCLYRGRRSKIRILPLMFK